MQAQETPIFDRVYKMEEFRKQISLFLPLSDWKALRREAARLRIPMTELCRRWMTPGLTELRQRPLPDPDQDE